ncbi:DUF4405 domain-containing protein [Thermococcus sp.]
MGRWTAPAWLRGSIDLLLTIVFVLLAVSGIALYLAPSGRIAETLGWTFLGLSKETWTEVHTYMGFAMIGLVSVHLVVGFRSMLTMLRSALKKAKWKPIAATAVMLLTLAGGFRVYATYYGESEDGETLTVKLPSNVSSLTVDISGAEIKSLTLDDLAKAYDVPVTSLEEELKVTCNITAQSNETLENLEYSAGIDRETLKECLAVVIGKLKGVDVVVVDDTPIYVSSYKPTLSETPISNSTETPEATTEVEITGSMLKSYTLEQVAKLYNVSPEDLVSLLRSEYDINAQPDEPLDEIITNNDLDREKFKEELTEAIKKLKGGES